MISTLKPENKELFSIEVPIKKDAINTSLNRMYLGIFTSNPKLINVWLSDSGFFLDAAEARQLIEALQKAIEIVEAK